MTLDWRKQPWDRLTVLGIPLSQWWTGSVLSKVPGLLQPWRKGSTLLQWSEPLAVALLSLAFGTAPYFGPQTGPIGLMLFAIGAFWLLLRLSDPPALADRVTPTHLLLLLYWLIATAATLISPVRSAALDGWLKLTLYFLLFALLARVLRAPRYRSWLVGVYLFTALSVAIYGLRQVFFGAEALATWTDAESDLANTTRVYSYLRNPNLLAGYLLPAIPLGLAAALRWRSWGPKAVALTITLMSAFCLVQTYSRAGWIGLVVEDLVLCVLWVYWWARPQHPGVWWRSALPIALGSQVALLAVAVLAVPKLRARALSIFAWRGDSSNNVRINVWKASLRMAQDYPVLGIGPGNDAFNRVYPLYQEAGYTALGTYCVPLEIALETGLVGLAVYLCLVAVTLWGAVRSLQRLHQQRDPEAFWLIGALTVVAGLMAQGLFDTVWYRPQVQMLWWLCIALLVSFWQPEPGTEAQPSD